MNETSVQPPEPAHDLFEMAHQNVSRLRKWAWRHAERAERWRVDLLAEKYLREMHQRQQSPSES